MEIRKIYFIRSSLYADNGQLVKATSIFDRLTIKNLAEMAIPQLAAYVPREIAVEMVDDCLDDVDFNCDAEVIAISAWIIHRDRAIDLAKEFKKRGKTVLIGGYLATMHPEEVAPYVDSICIGEGDLIFPQMIFDIQNDMLQPRYEADFKMSLDNIPTPRYDLIKRSRSISLSSSMPIQATRGCPYSCDYCSITAFNRGTYRYRPVEDVIRDIKSHGKKQIHFVDDNLMENRKYAKELFTKMIGLKVIWGTQITINVANDPEMLDLAYRAGCRVVMIGMESVNQSNLDNVSKEWTNVDKFKDSIYKIQKAGIGVHALIVFGFPADNEDVFMNSANFLIDAGCFSAEFFILTPYPATPLGKKYLRENKIFDFNLSHYREPYVVFKHERLTPDQLQSGYWSAFNHFYSLKSIFKRLRYGNSRHKLFQLAHNLYYWVKLKRKIVPTHFQRGNYSFSKFDSCNNWPIEPLRENPSEKEVNF